MVLLGLGFAFYNLVHAVGNFSGKPDLAAGTNKSGYIPKFKTLVTPRLGMGNQGGGHLTTAYRADIRLFLFLWHIIFLL